MSIHDEIQEMIPAYALGALDSEEMARATAHLASCDRCARLLDEYRPVAESLAFAAPLVALPRDLRARTMQRATRSELSNAPRASAARRQSGWPRLGLAPVLAGAALVIALLAFGWNAWQTAQLNQQLATQRDLMTFIAYAQGNSLTVLGTSLAPEADGRLYFDPDANVAALITVNLPMLDDSHVYQVWLTEPNGKKISGGTFRVDRGGNGWLLVRAPQQLQAYAQVGVTPEPRGGSLAPTAKPVLLAQLTAP
jgi:anti-sigma-K factor RskA